MDTSARYRKFDELRGLSDDPEYLRLVAYLEEFKDVGLPTLAPFLPAMLRIKGKPYKLERHFVFEPFFRTRTAKRWLLKCGRQIGKSMTQAALGIIFSAANPYFSTLYVTPLFEMIRKFSHNYVRELIDTSPLRDTLLDETSVNQILQRTFANGATMYFSYAMNDAERTRGIPADAVSFDEIQSMDYDVVPLICQTMGGSPYELIRASGTPLSLDNTIQQLWEDSSQAEWVIKCEACGKWNVNSLEGDLLKMIGPASDKIGPDRPGVVCARCSKPIFPHTGHWLHAHPERRWSNAGYHIPQQVMPGHYADPMKWGELVAKSKGRFNTTQAMFLNEVCGESCDQGAKLLTDTDVRRAASLPWPNVRRLALQRVADYPVRFLTIDWGGTVAGFGDEEETKKKRNRTSFTTMAVLGWTLEGKIHVLWSHRVTRSLEFAWEANLAADVFRDFRCHKLVHDYTGAGEHRQEFMKDRISFEHVIPVSYHRPAAGALMFYNGPTEARPLGYYALDKSRSLVMTCEAIRRGFVLFHQDDYRDSSDPGVLRDLLALYEEKVQRDSGRDLYVIRRKRSQPDDFAQALNIGAHSMWMAFKRYPELSHISSREMSEHDVPDWDAIDAEEADRCGIIAT